MQSYIKIFLQKQNLDIRIKGKEPASRFIDQKVTPDILSVICNSILSLDNSNFTSRDIWDSSEFSTSMKTYFGKGDVNLQDFKNEYDKIISQCLNTLNFSNIITLIGKKGSSNNFKLLEKEILIFISSSDKNSYLFLLNYLEETLKQSNFIEKFNYFFNKINLTQNDYIELKDSFDKFIKLNSNINDTNIYETRRIFTKVINPLAVFKNSLGSHRGRLSKNPITYAELLYNRLNWRDIGKPKGISRQEYRLNQSNDISENARKYSIAKAKHNMKNFHKFKNNNICESEIYDKNFQCTDVIHAHHIFPSSDFEEISDTLENMILLTVNQHYSFAHPGGTQKISRNYQEKCLLAKLKTILDSKYSSLYDINRFIDVLEIGLNIIINRLDLFKMSNLEIKNYLSNEITNYYSIIN